MANAPRTVKRPTAMAVTPKQPRGNNAPVATADEPPKTFPSPPATLNGLDGTPSGAAPTPETIEQGTVGDTPPTATGAGLVAQLRAGAADVPEEYTLPPEVETPVAVAAPEPLESEEEQNIHTHLRDYHRVVSPDAYPHSVKIVIAQLEEYVAAMGPKAPVDAITGQTHQRKLYNSFLTALQAGNGEYMIAITVIMYFFHRYRNECFDLRLVYRFMDTIKLDATNRSAFQQLINLFVETANPATRARGLKAADLNKVVTFLPSNKCKEHLLAFYAARR